MKKAILIIITILIAFSITGCYSSKESNKATDTNINESENQEMITSINITINDKAYTANIETNETAQAFVNKLPQDFVMDELNGNEKYVYMDTSFQTSPSNPKHIERGDIMLYGNNCLVIFYKSFDTSYSYTKIGHIDNLPDLGSDKITAKFER